MLFVNSMNLKVMEMCIFELLLDVAEVNVVHLVL